MKQFLLLCLLQIVLLLPTHAQISINNTDMPVVNDTLRYSTAATNSFTPANLATSTGANYTWNYGFLTPPSQLLESFKSSTSTPYLLYFAGMVGYKRADSISLGPLVQKNVWDFYKTTTAKYTIEGTGFTTSGIPLASDYSDPDELYYFPLNYSDQDSGTFSVSTTIPGIGGYIQAGKRKNTVDGWGQITTPFGTFSVLRVKSVITETDTIKITTPFAFTIPFTNNRIEYRWLAKGIHIPILEVTISNGIGGTNITEIKYRDQYRYIPQAPAANFTANTVFPKIGNTVILTDQSANLPTRWKWTITPATYTFANGTNDTLQNIQVKFTANGNYNVSLRATNAKGNNTATKNAYIKVGDVPVIKFGASKLNANIADLININDSSSNTPTRWKWTILPSSYTYNTGSVDTLKNVVVSFSKGGFYTVDLKVTNPWGSDQATKTNYIWINFPAGINANSTSGMAVYPNPVTKQLQFETPEFTTSKLRVYDSFGKLVMEGNAKSGEAIDVSALSAGVYIIDLENNGKHAMARFIKE